MAEPKLLSLPGKITQSFLPAFRYELLVCGLRGHEIVGTDAGRVRPSDDLFVRELGGLRWHRCLRCDGWTPLPAPAEPRREFPPGTDEVKLPRRGRALRDLIVLRLIAIDRAFHFVLLAALAIGILVFASHRTQLQRFVDRLDTAFYGSGASARHPAHGLLHDLERLVTLDVTTLRLIALAAGAYALLEGAEAFGLWYQQRWAEYLTLIATAAFLPFEVWELTKTQTPLKIGALAVNLAIVLYLLLAKRLFGIRGGAAADRAAREHDSGWDAFRRLSPAPPGPAEP
jgi:uncharacterized membrane protein (DUF2068 family)